MMKITKKTGIGLECKNNSKVEPKQRAHSP